MNFVVYLLDHVPLYLIVIKDLGHDLYCFLMIFQRIPFILVLTLQNKNLYFYGFFSFMKI
jgi:hypothetical protein